MVKIIKMKIKCRRTSIKGNFLNLFENSKISLGYTENNFNPKDLESFFQNDQIIELKQTHSNDIWISGDIKPGSRGDGIILKKKKKMAVIKTADCIPLFFWDDHYSVGGILHIGWRGLLKQIEKKLFEQLKKMNINSKNVNFYFGPCIEKKCYRVDQKLFNRFNKFSYRNSFFEKNEGHFFMDLKMGISTSLIQNGVSEKNIHDSQLCNFCNTNRFPSYRREGKTDSRIFNFLYFK